MEPRPHLSVVIVTHNNQSLLKGALSSLVIALSMLPFICEIIIIDNASTDGTTSFLEEFRRKYYDKFIVKIIYNKVNNHSYAVNLGVSKAQGEYILKLDDDVILKSDSIFEALKIIEKDKSIGSVQSMWWDWSNPEIGYYHQMDYLLNTWRVPLKLSKHNSTLIEVPFPIIFSVVFRRDVSERIGHFILDPWYHVAYDEVDFGLRIKLAGLRNVIATKSLVKHLGPAKRTPDKYFYFEFRNRLATILSCYPLSLCIKAVIMFLSIFIFVSAFRIVLLSDKIQMRCVLKSITAVKDILFNLSYLIQKRRIIKAIVRSEHSDLNSIFCSPRLKLQDLIPNHLK